MRISDWSSDVCSSDLDFGRRAARAAIGRIKLELDAIAAGNGVIAAGRHHEIARRRHCHGRNTVGQGNGELDTLRAAIGTVAARMDAGRRRTQAFPYDDPIADAVTRSEERRVGKECVSTCRSRWSTYP